MHPGELIVFGRGPTQANFPASAMPSHVAALNLTVKHFVTKDPHQSRCHGVIWAGTGGRVFVRALEQGGIPTKNTLFTGVHGEDRPSVLVAKDEALLPGEEGDCAMPLNIRYMSVGPSEQPDFFMRVEWKHCELLCFACSPAASPVPDSGNEVVEVARDCQWGDTVSYCMGGDLPLIQRKLAERATRRFLFSGHADLSDLSVAGQAVRRRTLGLTRPGGGLLPFSESDPALIADLFGRHSCQGGKGTGLLELVFINGCCSDELGRQISRQGVDFVVCWQTKTVDMAARIFSRRFFQQCPPPPPIFAETICI